MTHDRTTDSAGAGSPAPAESSAVPSTAGSGADVVAPEARVELDRIRRRWAQLPVDRAEARMPVLRGLLADLAPRSTPVAVPVPDLGPAVVVDQLTVLVWDAYAAEGGDGVPQLLTEARRDLG